MIERSNLRWARPGICALAVLAACSRLCGDPASAAKTSHSGGEPAPPGVETIDHFSPMDFLLNEHWLRFDSIVTDAERSERTARAHFLTGRLLAARRDYEAALDSLKKARSARPEVEAISLAIVWTQYQAGDYEGALREAERAVAAQSESVEARLALAACHEALQGGDLNDKHRLAALEQYEETRKIEPGNLRALDALGQLRWDEYHRQPPNSPERAEAAAAAIALYEDTLNVAKERDRLLPLLKLALIHDAEGQVEKAEARYNQAIAIDPRNIPAQLMLGRLYESRGRLDDAVEVYRKALVASEADQRPRVLENLVPLLEQKSKQAPAEFFQRLSREFRSDSGFKKLYAERLIADGRQDEAVRVLRDAIDLDPGDALGRLELSRLLIGLGRVAEAAPRLREAEALRPDDPSMLAELADCYGRAGLMSEANRLIAKALERAPEADKADFWRAKAQIQVGANDIAGAVESMRESLRLRPGDPGNTYLLVLFLISEKRFEESLAILNEAARVLPESQRAALHIRRADVYDLMGQPENTLRALEDARKAAKGAAMAEVDIRKAAALAALDRFGEAESVLKNLLGAASAAPERINALLSLASLYQKAGRTSDAEKAYREVIDINPRFASAYLGLGMLYDSAERIAEADAIYRQLLEFEPNNPEALNNLGYLYASRGMRLDEARQLIERALELSPDAAHILDSMGWVLYQQGEYEPAVQRLEHAVEALGGLAGADPADAEIYEHLGDAYRKNNRPGDARKAYEKGLKADPKRESLQQRLDALNTAEDER